MCASIRANESACCLSRGRRGGSGWKRYVFVVRTNQLGVGKSTLEKREIHVGIADATNYEVVSGLKEEDWWLCLETSICETA